MEPLDPAHQRLTLDYQRIALDTLQGMGTHIWPLRLTGLRPVRVTVQAALHHDLSCRLRDANGLSIASGNMHAGLCKHGVDAHTDGSILGESEQPDQGCRALLRHRGTLRASQLRMLGIQSTPSVRFMSGSPGVFLKLLARAGVHPPVDTLPQFEPDLLECTQLHGIDGGTAT